MDTLRNYLNSLQTADQRRFALACGTTLGYLRKAISAGQALGEALVINIDRESDGKVRCEDLRPDVDWAYLRGRAGGEDCPPPSPTRPLSVCGQGAANTALQIGGRVSTAAQLATDGSAQAAAATTGAELGVA